MNLPAVRLRVGVLHCDAVHREEGSQRRSGLFSLYPHDLSLGKIIQPQAGFHLLQTFVSGREAERRFPPGVASTR